MDKPSQWSKNELVAYILLYVANADLNETEDEKKYMLSRVDKDTYKSVHKQFDKDNDYQCIQNIIEGVKTHNYFENDYAQLFADIKLMIYADGEAEGMEKVTLSFLRKILKK